MCSFSIDNICTLSTLIDRRNPPHGGNMIMNRDQILAEVKTSLEEVRRRRNVLPGNIRADSAIEVGELYETLDELSKRIRMKVVFVRRKPRRGWRVSTLTGYVEHNQHTFPLLEQALKSS
jgi:hypothetical protein